MFLYLKYFTDIPISQARVAEYLGIPRTTLSDYIRGIYQPSPARRKTIEAGYARYTYQQLRVAGVNTRDSKRFSTSPQAKVSSVIERYSAFVERKANDIWSSELERKAEGKPTTFNSYDEAYAKVQEGVSESHKEIERIEDSV